MNLNRKGFTLIELLVTIVIVGILLVFAVMGVTKILQVGKEKQREMIESSIENATQMYIEENHDVVWTDADVDGEQQFCLTVGKLINSGFIDKKKIEDSGIQSNTFIIVKKNKITHVIEKIVLTNDGELCE